MRALRAGCLVVLAVLLFSLGFGAARWMRPGPAAGLSPLTCYRVENGTNHHIAVWLTTQFGRQFTGVWSPALLCTPATKTLPKGRQPMPVKRGDHLHCYEIQAPVIGGPVDVTDQFGTQKNVNVKMPAYLCEPADKDEDKS